MEKNLTRTKEIKDKEGNVLKTQVFMVEDTHPVIGRILTVDDKRYRILDEGFDKRQGTFIRAMTQEDEQAIKEYDANVEELSEKLIKKVDIKRMIKEQIKSKSFQAIKTGLFILKAEEKGEKIEVEHHRGCYHFKLSHKGQEFDFASGTNVVDTADIEFNQ